MVKGLYHALPISKSMVNDVNIDNKRGRHCNMVLEDNDGGVDAAKALLHAKRWDLYVN